MSIIDRTDAEENFKRQLTDKVLLNPASDDAGRLRVLEQLSSQRYKLGLPLRERPSDVDVLNAMHPEPARVAAEQLREKYEADFEQSASEKKILEAQIAALQELSEWTENLKEP